MKRIPVLLIATIFIFLLSACGKDTARTIAVEELNGTTHVTNQSGTMDVYVGQHLISGDDVNVETDSNMTLLIDMDKHLFADAGTHFSLEATGSKGNTQTKINLFEGSVLSGIDNKLKAGETYEVSTPNATMAVRGTIFFTNVKYVDSVPITELSVQQGTVVATYMENGEEISVEISEGSNRILASTEKNYVGTDMTKIDISSEESNLNSDDEHNNSMEDKTISVDGDLPEYGELIHVTGEIVETQEYPELKEKAQIIQDSGNHFAGYTFISDIEIETPDGKKVTYIGTGVPYSSMDELFDESVNSGKIDCYGFLQHWGTWPSDVELYGTDYWFTIIEINGTRATDFNEEDWPGVF